MQSKQPESSQASSEEGPDLVPHRVAVVGAGVVSPLGRGMPESARSLWASRDCVSAVTAFDVEQCRCKTAGQVASEALEPAARARPRLHRAAHMMILALEEAILEAGGARPEAAVIGTTSGGMTFGESYYRSLYAGRPERRQGRWIANYPPQKPALDAMEACGITGPCQVIANACASGTNALGVAFESIRLGRHRKIIAGGYDAISELVFVGFDSLQAATPEKCRPFDRDRSGLVLGEGAAVLILEEWESAKKRGAPILAEIIGYGISTDNHHLTQPDPSGAGPGSAMRAALAEARLEPAAVSYINAHGTATPFNDAAEGKAIQETFGPVPVSSTKSMIGHTLGAAGAIEAACCLLALRDQKLPPNINFRSGDPNLSLNIATAPEAHAGIDVVLSNSFGFGGTNASLLLKRAA